MDELDQICINEALTRNGVAATQSKDAYFASPHPIDEMLSAAAARIPHPIELLISEEGRSEHFFISGLNCLPVIFSARFIGLSERIIRIDNSAFDSSLKAQLAEGIAHEVISEYLLTQRETVGAALCFMKARLTLGQFAFCDNKALLGAASDLLSVESRGVDELYITDMFYGLAHEFGHAIQDCQSDGPPWCSDAQIEAYVALVAAGSQGDAGESYRHCGPSATLATKRLRHEAGADIEGCILLARAAHPIVTKYGQLDAGLDIQRFIGGIARNFATLGFLAGCRRTADFICMKTVESVKAVELLQQPIGFVVRQMLLKDHLPLIAAAAMGAQDNGLAAMFGSGARDVRTIAPPLSQFVSDMWATNQAVLRDYLELINLGLLRAMEFWNRTHSPAQFAQISQDYVKRRQVGDYELAERDFIVLADTMQLSDHDLRTLMTCLEFAPAFN